MLMGRRVEGIGKVLHAVWGKARFFFLAFPIGSNTRRIR